MTGFESLMWELERDPQLSSAFANLTIFDRAPDRLRFRDKMEKATYAVPRLRQRVVGTANPLDRPRWVDDPDFDLDHHLRWTHLGGDADLRELYDLAATLSGQPFDRQRPLWEFVTIEGLRGGRAAMLQRLHHTITDGEGGIRLSVQFLDFERHPPEDRPPASKRRRREREAAGATEEPAASGAPPPGADHSRPWWGRATEAVTGIATTAMNTGASALATGAAGATELPRRGSEFAGMARSTWRQARVGQRRSPLWTERSLGRWFGTTVLALEDVRTAAHVLGGSVNDLFITGAVDAAGAVHRDAGTPVDELRVSMPVSTRHDRSAGGNAFSPTQMLAPTGQMEPVERFSALHDILAAVKEERVIGALEGAATAASVLPPAAIVRTGQYLAGAVDFVCSNVRAAPFDLFIGGAFMEANYPLGPLAGTAFNLTTMSYRGWLFLGLTVDSAAVPDPDALLEQLDRSYDALLAAGGVTERSRP
jgi:diacylglycerol O-acyltransferase / wax synthase